MNIYQRCFLFPTEGLQYPTNLFRNISPNQETRNPKTASGVHIYEKYAAKAYESYEVEDQN